MTKKITIKDIAKEAGVSVSTVSRVLNNHPSVNPQKRKIVQEVIERENFQPSMLARGMVSNQTKNIAVVLSDINNPYFTDLVAQIDEASRENGYSLLMFNTLTAGPLKIANPVFAEQQTLATILEKKVDGVIILGGEIDKKNPDPKYIAALNKIDKEVPMIIVGQSHPDITATFLPRALNQGTKLALQHLLALGKRKIGFIGGEPAITITEERLVAYRETLALYSSVNENWIKLSDFYAKSGYQSMQALLTEAELPQAVIAINDKVALGAIRALQDAGLTCPEDMAIVSCDAFLDGEYTVPRLTTINQNNHRIGKEAVQLLMKKIDKQPIDQTPPHVPEIIIRESCGVNNNK
ncbi:LacI family transcriptional regulator [Enterococcus sp. PF1-24]|uniref:LacI family DNA-binding transcriptional regulator n=1 Tax=unclassified Enterococcus TaxID=2608891 RepID=UPI002474E532|nr:MULTISPECIES: LacI family DNA-binding transcriptional regulator [unclassified Enterococcus]MDH6363354.1 LacI family transcriptional regulator [Enterococcus sp. PFB1-1]MDH6400345.1 LacI family transcriptional regulator [Enterococcus sp. PF1-24]